jgi:signal transduction histidine kinase
MATLGQLTATVSHELRNPLGTIRTSMFTLANRINSKDDSVKHVFERIDRNIVRCDSIITELLDYSRIRALQHQKTNLGHWIKRLLDEIDLPDDISISLNLDDSVEAEIDRDLFRRVLVNVIENAAQAVRGIDGTVSIKNIIIECRINHNRTEIIITDSGPGIEQDILPHIFEPLFSTKTFGIGLGLSIVKQIMLQHGGNVDIDSEPGVGTRVVLWLPFVSKDISRAVSLVAKRGT